MVHAWLIKFRLKQSFFTFRVCWSEGSINCCDENEKYLTIKVGVKQDIILIVKLERTSQHSIEVIRIRYPSKILLFKVTRVETQWRVKIIIHTKLFSDNRYQHVEINEQKRLCLRVAYYESSKH